MLGFPLSVHGPQQKVQAFKGKSRLRQAHAGRLQAARQPAVAPFPSGRDSGLRGLQLIPSGFVRMYVCMSMFS